MDKKTHYRCLDGRAYDITMAWNEAFKAAETIFSIKFSAIDPSTKRALVLPREFATYSIGDPQESLGERVEHYYGGNREEMMGDYVTSAYRRVCDYIERGK